MRSEKRFVDGLGYNRRKTDQIVMESSGGLQKESADHVVNDTLKNVHSSICIIDGVIRMNINSNFSTVVEVEVVCIQFSGRYSTLATRSLDKENPGKYIHVQRHHASIPIASEDRYEWIPLFELLSFLPVLLDNQENVGNVMKKERNGVNKVDPEKTVHKVLSYQE